MASAVETFGSIPPSGRAALRGGKPRRLLSGATIVGIAGAALVWMIAAYATLHSVTQSAPPAEGHRLQASLGLNPIIRAKPQAMRVVALTKFSRLTVLPRIDLIAAAKAGRKKSIVAMAQANPGAVFAEKMRGLALAEARVPADTRLITASTPVVASALVETVPLEDAVPKPFDLVMSDQAAELSGLLPDLGPLPLSRPAGSRSTDGERQVERDGKPAQRQLAYARPGLPAMEDDRDDVIRPAFRGRKGVAYYDISAGVVHMPNGEKLEAHSGIGEMRDNPDFAHVKMRGPTPPGTYKVTMREALFHGVEAVRLTPTDGIAPLGRTGLLAHSYLLRKPGDSHGCVAFANYPKFLKAFKRGEITHMVIVKSMKGGFSRPTKTLASLFGSSKDR